MPFVLSCLQNKGGQIDLCKGRLFSSVSFLLYQAYYRVTRAINFYNKLGERTGGILLFDIGVMCDMVTLSELKHTHKNKTTKLNKNKAVRMIIVAVFLFFCF